MLESIDVRQLAAVTGGYCAQVDGRWMPTGALYVANPFPTGGFTTRAVCRDTYKTEYGLK